MKKNLLQMFVCVVCALACAGLFSACGGEGEPPEEPGQQPFTVTFVTNGGTAIEPVRCTEKSSFQSILGDRTTSYEGKIFTGWYVDELLQTKAAPNLVVSADKTFYAAWRDLTDAEILEQAAMNAYRNALAIKDTGYVRTGLSASAAHTVEATLTLENGVVTAGSNGARYFADGLFYLTRSEEKTKLKPNDAREAVAFLYHNETFASMGFFSAFSPLAMARVAEATGEYPLTRTGDTFTVKYLGNASAIGLNWAEQGDPTIYFEGGKTFEFTLSEGRLARVKQSGGRGGRTVEFFYEGDELPEVAEPEDKQSYVQKWQVKVSPRGSGTSILYLENLNKEDLDHTVFGDDLKPQTSKLNYYSDTDLHQAIDFSAGDVALDKHLEIYHPGIDWDNITVARFDYSYGNLTFSQVSDTTAGGVRTVTLKAREAMNGVRSFSISIMPRPSNAKDKRVKVTFAETPTNEDIYADALTLNENEYYTGLDVRFPVSGEYLLKIESADGSASEYLRILPQD